MFWDKQFKSRQFANSHRDSFMDIREQKQTKPGTTSRIEDVKQILDVLKLIIKRFITKNKIDELELGALLGA